MLFHEEAARAASLSKFRVRAVVTLAARGGGVDEIVITPPVLLASAAALPAR